MLRYAAQSIRRFRVPGLPTAGPPEYALLVLIRRILVLALLLTGLGAWALSADIVPLGFDAQAFKDQFNASSDKGRLVLILSPT